MLGEISAGITGMNREYVNTAKEAGQKAQFSAQRTGARVLKRNGMSCDCATGKFILRMSFCVPLINAVSVNAKAAVRAVRDILDCVENTMKFLNFDKLGEYAKVHSRQREIRAYLKRGGLCAFVADGSILPRENGTELPKKDAVPFVSPDSLRVTVLFSGGTRISGMAIKQGVTVITGGGYSGKSTLLDALEMGIYNHIPGDGREYVITDSSALKIYAEDGRPVHSLDMSPFFKYLPGDASVSDFSTFHASGSVSQAANIIEAVYGGSGVLLIDEDKSAVNFMICDPNMRKIVKHEPIIPFTDRICELYSEKKVSTILVIGGSSEFLLCADTVILMDDYAAEDITPEIAELFLPARNCCETAANFRNQRFLLPRKTNQPFLYLQTVETENEKKIILDDYSSDITHLTSLVSADQMNSLSNVMEQLLTDMLADSADILCKIDAAIQTTFALGFRVTSMSPESGAGWYEEVRTLDAFCCINRMRGVSFR